MNVTYALLPSRVKALVIDQVIIIAAMYLVSELFILFESVSTIFRIAAFVILFLIYEPFFVSFFGGTIGHQYSNISVRSEGDITRKILFPWAVVRLITKVALGWLSLLMVTSSTKRQAIHDVVVKSVVIETPET